MTNQNRKIPPSLYPELYKQYAVDNKSTAEIAAWLLAEHGIVVSDRAVRKRVLIMKKDKEEISKAVMKDELMNTAAANMQIFTKNVQRLDDIFEAAKKEKNAGAQIRAIAEQNKVAALRAGMLGPEEKPENAENKAKMKQGLLAVLSKLQDIEDEVDEEDADHERIDAGSNRAEKTTN